MAPPQKKQRNSPRPIAQDEFIEGGVSGSTFLFELAQLEIGRFRQVSGLQVSIKMTPHREGGENGFVHHLPGRIEWPNITLTKGVTKSDELFRWFDSTARGQNHDAATTDRYRMVPTTGAITLIAAYADEAGKPQRLRSWNLDGVVPVKWTGPTFAADNDQALTESLEIAHQGFTVEDHKAKRA